MPTPTPLPTPTPSGGGEDCSNPGYRKLGDECVFCPEEFGLNASKRCHLNLDLKVEHFNQADNDNDAPPVVFSPRDVNGQFDQLNFQVKEQFGRDGGQLVDWTLSVSKKGSTAKLWEKEGKGEEPLPYDGWTDDQGAQDCLRDGEYEVNLVPLKRVFAPSVGRAVVLDNIIVTPEKGEFQVDNTPSVVKDLLVVQNPKNPLPEEEDQVKTTVSFMIKEPLVNQISAGLHPDMYLSSAGTQWLSIDVDDEPLFVDEPFMIASVLPRSYYDIQKVDDRTAVVTFTVDGKAYGRSMVLTMTDALGNTSKQIFWLKAE